MGESTGIAWTDRTFNPWEGCVKISPGCKNCYAEALSRRWGKKIWGPDAGRPKTKSPWKNVMRWNAEAQRGFDGVLGAGYPTLVFLGSLMDWAEDNDKLRDLRDEMWSVVRRCRAIHFQMLTKRADCIERFLPPDWGAGWSHVWLGVSIENQDYAWRADALRAVPAAVRFVSYEPALGPLSLDLGGIDWLIYGGESGPGWRPEGGPGDPKAWARSIRDQCRGAGVAFFHKQSASLRPGTGYELDGELIQEFPEVAPVEKVPTLF